MTTISDERLAEIVGAGVPCVPIEPWEVTHVVQELRSLRAQGGVRAAAERLLAHWDERDGPEKRGEFEGVEYWSPAGRMVDTEFIAALRSALEASPAPVSEEMVQRAWVAFDDKAGYSKPERLRAALTAALAAKGGQ